MKVLFNTNLQIKDILQRGKINNSSDSSEVVQNESIKPPLGLSKSYNLSFQSKCQANILFTQTKNLSCALSGRRMIPQTEIEPIYEKMSKKTNIQSMIIFLQIYQDYMHPVERKIFEMFKNYKNYGTKNFQDILKEQYPKAQKKLISKEINILKSADDKIDMLEGDIAKKVKEIRNVAITKASQGTICRSDVLTQIKELEADKDSEKILKDIYAVWYNLPNSYKDTDAFIVEYSNYQHDEIAHRLISTAVATLKPIKPLSEGGERTLGNYLLVSKLAAKDSAGMSLKEYFELSPESKECVQRYVNEILTLKEDNRPLNIARLKYPQAVKRAIAEETDNTFSPDLGVNKAVKSNPLLAQIKYLKCAFSGKPMISPYKISSIYGKLSKKTNAESAVRFLQNYEDYMHDTERKVFEMIKGAKDIDAKDFQDVLTERYAESYRRLKKKQLKILTETDGIIAKLSDNSAKQAAEIRDFAILKVKEGTFNYKNALKQLEIMDVPEADKDRIHEIYKHWYHLPNSNNDYDAFVVRYAHQTHEKIAQRLISSAVATVKPVKETLSEGENSLGNSIVVSKKFDNFDNMSLEEYIELNPDTDIKKNIQTYLDDFVSEINAGTKGFVTRKWYPEAIKRAVWKASGKTFMPEIKTIEQKKSVSAPSDFRQKIPKNGNVVKVHHKYAVHSKK